MATIAHIINSMSREVRSKAEAYARAKGISLEEAVAQQLESELSDADLAGAAGGTEYNTESGGTEYNVETILQ